MIVMKSLVAQHIGLLQDLESSGQRQVLVQAVVTDIQHLMLASRGYLSVDVENATRAHMRSCLTDIETLHNQLYLQGARCVCPCVGVREQGTLYSEWV